ncbi:MAG: ABC transporter substrate-binding protein [Pseudomonadota bacterium]|nr:ABC transporter substrate-binding protein [Pseudomonadota bacterium]
MCNLNRSVYRVLFALTIPLLLLGSLGSPYANEVGLAERLIENLSGKIIGIVESDLSIEQKHENLESLFTKYANIKVISRAALGSKWRAISEKTRDKFSKAFTYYLIRKYGKQFEEFEGAKMFVERSADAGKRGILVSTRFIMPGSSPISVKWQLWSKASDLKLIDIIIEDISMLTMEREEIKNRLVLHGGNINSLIEELYDL